MKEHVDKRVVEGYIPPDNFKASAHDLTLAMEVLQTMACDTIEPHLSLFAPETLENQVKLCAKLTDEGHATICFPESKLNLCRVLLHSIGLDESECNTLLDVMLEGHVSRPQDSFPNYTRQLTHAHLSNLVTTAQPEASGDKLLLACSAQYLKSICSRLP